jgi:membrane protein YdbS with pleckstrin-like domain
MGSEGTAATEFASFRIMRDAVAHYLFVNSIIAGSVLLVFGGAFALAATIDANQYRGGAMAVLLVVLALCALFAVYIYAVRFLARAHSRAISYRLEGKTLRVDSGLIFLSRKAIQLDRITDLNLTRGPLMAMCGIWSIRVQTAGANLPEAILYGLEDPEKVRDLLIAAHDKAAAISPPGF